jgi:hypothetical protein
MRGTATARDRGSNADESTCDSKASNEPAFASVLIRHFLSPAVSEFNEGAYRRVVDRGSVQRAVGFRRVTDLRASL